MTSSSSSIFWLIVVNRNCLQEFCCHLITSLQYDTIHVVSFRKAILVSTMERTRKSFKELERQVLICIITLIGLGGVGCPPSGF